jgi:hypothetical protein
MQTSWVYPFRRNIHSTVSHVLNGSVLADVNVQPLRLVVHCAHAVGLQDAVLLGEVCFCEGLESVSALSVKLA